ncbi:MAG TPA: hypothetical protein PLD83_02730 [Oscillospiraceae bacterium]|nr:hypothetical protein [Oscillospiraceae bacterium]HNY00227.1 hypothetical protein [Oscillospiraceae bacterium]HPS75336.1 hypothetical protein [Oscillospiraceae bacterium]
MKKLWETLLFAAVFASLLMTFAFADLVQPGPVEVLTSFGLPLLIIAAAVIALALIIKAVNRKRVQKKDEDKDKHDDL